MSLWEAYLQPTSLDEALNLLQQQSSAALVAGGTDLLLDLRQKRHEPVQTLIDVSRIPDLLGVSVDEKHVFIGAAVTHHSIVHHPDVMHHAPGLVEACELIGGPQVRNVATLGGNVGHALPAGDGSIALVSLDAEALLASGEGERWLPIRDLFAGPGKATFERASTIIVGFRFPVRESRQGHAFSRVMRPQGVAIAILNMGVWISLHDDGRIRQARIAAGPGGPTPFRAEEAEKQLVDAVWGPEAQGAALAAMQQEIKLRTSRHRATLEYRQHLTTVLFERVAELAYSRALEFQA